MKKETLLEIILGTIGGLIFAIGMCMCLIPEWNLFTAGVIVGVIGFIILLCITIRLAFEASPTITLLIPNPIIKEPITPIIQVSTITQFIGACSFLGCDFL